MKSTIALLVFGTMISSTAFAITAPTTVPASFKKVYVPEGFDSNDNVQIVGEGVVPNTCYRYAHTEIDVDHENKTIVLHPTVYKYEGMCLMIVLPFDRVLDVGILKAGTYSILQGDDRRPLGQISITEAKSSEPDEFMYAPISQAYYKSGCITDLVLLSGNLPLKCMRIKEVRTHVQTDVFVLRPIVEIDNSIPCEEGEFPFETSVNAGFLKKGRYLIHVRSMNGKSVNSLVDVP